MRILSAAFLVVIGLVAPSLTVQPVLAQVQDVAVGDTVYVSLKNGQDVFGEIIEWTEEILSVQTFDGVVMTIPWENILSVVEASNRKYRRSDPNTSRLFFGPTARALGSGKGYFALYEIFFSFVGVGVGPHLNLAGGLTLIPAAPEQIIYAAPKITFVETEKYSAAAGVLAMKVTSEDDSWGLLYGVTSFGPSHQSFTAGLAYGFVNGEFGENPVLMLGAEFQASDSFKFITENYVIVGETVIISGGFRFFSTNFAADLAFFTSPDAFDGGGLPIIPWLGLALNFGR